MGERQGYRKLSEGPLSGAGAEIAMSEIGRKADWRLSVAKGKKAAIAKMSAG